MRRRAPARRVAAGPPEVGVPREAARAPGRRRPRDAVRRLAARAPEARQRRRVRERRAERVPPSRDQRRGDLRHVPVRVGPAPGPRAVRPRRPERLGRRVGLVEPEALGRRPRPAPQRRDDPVVGRPPPREPQQRRVVHQALRRRVHAGAGPAPAHGLVPPQRVQQLVQLLRRGRPDALELLHEAAELRREAAPRREPLRVAARPQRGLDAPPPRAAPAGRRAEAAHVRVRVRGGAPAAAHEALALVRRRRRRRARPGGREEAAAHRSYGSNARWWYNASP